MKNHFWNIRFLNRKQFSISSAHLSINENLKYILWNRHFRIETPSFCIVRAHYSHTSCRIIYPGYIYITYRIIHLIHLNRFEDPPQRILRDTGSDRAFCSRHAFLVGRELIVWMSTALIIEPVSTWLHIFCVLQGCR